MRVKVLILALMAALVALPSPASQLLAGTFSAPSPAAAPAEAPGAFGTLVEDPFLAGRLTFTPARTASDVA